MKDEIKLNVVLEQLGEVLHIIKNKTYDECYKTLKGHNFQEDIFDFNYKNLCLTLDNNLKLVGSVEIYDKNGNLENTESIYFLLKQLRKHILQNINIILDEVKK